MIPGNGGQVAPGAEMTGQAQIVSALGAPFVLEGLFGEADAEAMDAEPDAELAADAMGMDVENDAERATTTAAVDGGMIVDDDAANNIDTLCVFNLPSPCPETVKKVYRTVGQRPRHDKKQQQTETQTRSLARHHRDRSRRPRRNRVRYYRDDASAQASTPYCSA